MKVVIHNLAQTTLDTENSTKSFLQLFAENGIDWMHACGGKGRCTTCKMIILEGSENISKHSPFEEKLAKLNRLQMNERLACQCNPRGFVRLEVPEDGKLPHIEYSS